MIESTLGVDESGRERSLTRLAHCVHRFNIYPKRSSMYCTNQT